MSRLFIELYLDEDVDVLIAQLMRARGFVVVTTQEAGQLRNNDAEQLAYAVNQHKTLLTHNRVHFEGLRRRILRQVNPMMASLLPSVAHPGKLPAVSCVFLTL